MTIKELEEFRVICEKGSLAKAAKEIFMSPQGLSRVLKNLERELDCTLVNRTATGLDLTECGQCLLNYAEVALCEYDKLKDEIERIRENADGEIQLLAAYDTIRYITPESILHFQHRYKKVAFSYEEFPDRIVERKLLEHKGNVALSVGPFQRECFDVRSLKKSRLGLLVYEGHPLMNKKSVTAKDLEDELLYLENNQFKINELVQSACWSKGFEPNIVFETNGFDLCYKMCREHKGISVSIDFIHEDMKNDGLILIPFEEKELSWELGLITLKDYGMDAAVENFYHFVKNYLDETKCLGGTTKAE